MKTLLKYLSIVLLVVANFSCVDELEETIYKGNVQFNLTTTAEVTGKADDYSVKAKLYREYTGKTTTIELDVDSIYEDGTIVTESYEIEYGNYELQFVNLLNDGECEFCGVDKDDDRAFQIGEENYLPIAENVLENDTSVYSLKLVAFDDTEVPVEEIPPLTIAEFIALPINSVATIEASVTEVVTNTLGKVSYLMMQDSNGDVLKVFGVYNVSDVVYEVGDVLIVVGKRTGYNGEDGLELEPDSEHSITVEAKANSIAAFLKLADGTVGTIEAEVIEVSVNSTYGTVTYLIMKDSSGDEIKAYGVWKISDEIYTVGQTLRITAERDSYENEDQMSFSSDAGHSIEILSGAGDDENTIAEFLALELGTVGTIKAEVTEVSVNSTYGTVTYLMVKDSNGDELKAYGVFKVSEVIYEVGQTLLITGERGEYGGEAQLSFSSGSGHSIVIVDGGSGEVEKGSKDSPYTVEEARDIQDESTAWVEGYIVGFIVYDPDQNHTVTNDMSSSDITDTNIAIASTAGETDQSKMLFVQLTGSGSDARTQLGLATTSGASLGYKVKLNGQLTDYFSAPGLKGISSADQFEIVTE